MRNPEQRWFSREIGPWWAWHLFVGTLYVVGGFIIAIAYGQAEPKTADKVICTAGGWVMVAAGLAWLLLGAKRIRAAKK
jgi:hypothetical protein